ncbi:integrase catalytic domain-containing protein [Trichonephila clavipes]|nr:integrase catalytic domain-containing protein [Trichonephila clavipes]
MEWPASSPDMNSIEYAWDALGRRIAGHQPHLQTLQELKSALLEEWDRIPQLVINSLIDSMPQRFYHNSKSVSKVTGPLYTHEFETSIKRVVKLLQNGEYHTELTLLKCNKPFPKSIKLQSLNVFLDSEGILRVGGHLRPQQTLKFEQKHPMLIPQNHHFISLIIRHFHRVNIHAGQELVLSLIRQHFWIPHGKSAVKKELRKLHRLF